MQPDWSEAPEWAQWWAMDEDREAYWFKAKPESGATVWHSDELYQYDSTLPDWEDSLTQRPAKGYTGNIHISGSVTGSTIITGKDNS
jgi:hypothetical protein